MRSFCFLYIFILGLIILACKKSNNQSTPPTPQLLASKSTITLDSLAGSKDSFNITSNINWTISITPSNATWFTTNISSGSNNAKLIVTVVQDNSSGNVNSATIVLSPVGNTTIQPVNIVVNQRSKMLQLSASKLIIALDSVAGSKDSFNVTSNINWTISVTPSTATWFTTNVSSGSNNARVIVSATQDNNSGNTNSATIVLSPVGNATVQPVNILVTQRSRVNPNYAVVNQTIAYVNSTDLMVMNADGSNQQLILSANSVVRPKWSPDGHSILFAGTVTGVAGIWIIDVALVNGVATGSNLHKITINLSGTQGWPSWSPLGDLIAFTNIATGSDYDRNIYVIPPSGGTPTIVYSSPVGRTPHHPDWSPDAAKLVFSEGTDASPYQSNLVVFDRNSAQLTTVIPLTTSIAVLGPAWSRNGDRIAYTNFNSNPGTIYTVTPTANATPVNITTGNYPTWSPNDSKLAYFLSNPSNVYSFTFSGGGSQNLANGAFPDWRRF